MIEAIPKTKSGRTRCALCGSREIERDEVLDAGVLGLAECTRCHHRWTERPLRPALPALAPPAAAAA
jgi:hypothetical protein